MPSRVGLHNDRKLARAIEYFIELRGWEDAVVRAAEIACLPTVVWRGERLRRVLCCGTTGRGNHYQNVPDWKLWARMTVAPYYCPFHPRELEPSL